MRRVIFRDIQGKKGNITDEMTVNYHGRWEGQIESCIEQIAEEHAAEEVYDHIVVELPENAPVDGVERIDTDQRDEDR